MWVILWQTYFLNAGQLVATGNRPSLHQLHLDSNDISHPAKPLPLFLRLSVVSLHLLLSFFLFSFCSKGKNPEAKNDIKPPQRLYRDYRFKMPALPVPPFLCA